MLTNNKWVLIIRSKISLAILHTIRYCLISLIGLWVYFPRISTARYGISYKKIPTAIFMKPLNLNLICRERRYKNIVPDAIIIQRYGEKLWQVRLWRLMI